MNFKDWRILYMITNGLEEYDLKIHPEIEEDIKMLYDKVIE